ncbi:MAG: hypothetical protein RR415_08890 [Ruthenibacterium sp.]
MNHLRISDELNLLLHQVARDNKISVSDIIHAAELRILRNRASVNTISDLSLCVTLVCKITNKTENHTISPLVCSSGGTILSWRSRSMGYNRISVNGFRAILAAVCFSTNIANAKKTPYTPPISNQPYTVVEEL